jgi:ABC-type sugar transport system substrate-binding protein
MKRPMHMSSVFLTAMAATILTAAASQSRAAEIPFSRAKIIIEFNSTGNDVGVQVLLDGEPWKRVKIKSPRGGSFWTSLAAGA